MSGHFQFSRVIEQLIPSVIIGCLVVFANLKVTENQVADIRKELDRVAITEQARQQQLQQQSERLVGITAQLTAFLGQQVNINSAIDARLTYIERSQTVAGKR